MEQGLTDRAFCKNSSSQKETPKRLSLWNICGTVQQKSWSAKPPLWDFEACILFQKQVPSGRLSIFRYLTRLSLFYFSDVWSLSRLNSNVFQENFRLFDFVTGHYTWSDVRIRLFPLACPANAPLLDCRSWLANFTLQNAENPVPLTFLAPQPHGNACYMYTG